MVVGVGAADGGRVLARLPRRGEAVITEAGGRGVHREPGECLEIEPQLAHVRGHLRTVTPEYYQLPGCVVTL